MWWPDDRAWFVSTQVDYAWTYIGGAQECGVTLAASQMIGAGEMLDIEAAIAKLPAGARRVFVLHDVEGFKHEEIAQQKDKERGNGQGPGKPPYPLLVLLPEVFNRQWFVTHLPILNRAAGLFNGNA